MAKSWLQLVVDDVEVFRRRWPRLHPSNSAADRSASRCGPTYGSREPSTCWATGTRRRRGRTSRVAAGGDRARVAPAVGPLGGGRHRRPAAGTGGRPGARAAGLRGDRRLRADDRGLRARRRRAGCDARRPSGRADGPRAGAASSPTGHRRAGILAVATPLRRRVDQVGTARRGRGLPRSARGAGARSGSGVRASPGWPACADGWRRRAGGRTRPRRRSGTASISSRSCRCRSSERSPSCPTGRCCGGGATAEPRSSSWRPRVSGSRRSAPVRSSSAAHGVGGSGSLRPSEAMSTRPD